MKKAIQLSYFKQILTLLFLSNFCVYDSTNFTPSLFADAAGLQFERPGKTTRKVFSYKPENYDESLPAKVVMYFHGYCGSGNYFINNSEAQRFADQYNFVLVSATGLSSTMWECNSWTFKGSADGLGQNGDVTSCEEFAGRPDYCSASCDCQNECGWTHCLDDDVQFVHDFVVGDDTYTNSLLDIIPNFDPAHFFVMGSSNGGMFTWELGQNPITAPLIRAMSPIIGTPHCDYDLPQAEGTSVPVLLMMGENDTTVSPSNEPWPGNPSDTCITNRDGEEYNYVSAHRITTTWAQGVEGCEVTNPNEFPPTEFEVTLSSDFTLKCRTWCNVPGYKGHSYDCTMAGRGHVEPTQTYQAAFFFFSRW